MITKINNQFWGRMGEAEIRDWLILNGHEILFQNWRTSNLEIDLISRKENCCFFFEIKTRFINQKSKFLNTSEIHNLIDRKFNFKKQKNMKLAIKSYREMYPETEKIQIGFFSVVYFHFGKYIYHFYNPISSQLKSQYSENRSHFYDRIAHVPHF